MKTARIGAVVAAVLAIAGCAADRSAPPGAEPVATAPAQTAAAVREVPYLKVAMSCAGCRVPDGVAELITEGYAEAAARAGYKVGVTSEANLTITTYTQRRPASRAMFGAFAGKDELRALVVHGNRRFEVGDYYRNAWMGMNALSKKVGEMTFEKISQ